jgi:hypothetical protein
MNGKSQGAVDKRTVKMDNRNRPVGGESNYEGFSSFEFPANPVTPGSVWSGKTKLDTAMGSLALDAKYKFVGIKKVNGKTVAEIVTTFTGVMMGPVKGTATTHLLVNDGSLYSVIAKMTTEVKTSAEAQAMKVATDISVKRT